MRVEKIFGCHSGGIVRYNLDVARVAELADAYASGAYGVTLGGSNPLASTNFLSRFHGFMQSTPAPTLREGGLAGLRRQITESGGKLVLTNGCFDILHAGHVRYLTMARELGSFLLVAVNSDASVRELKGPGRPVNSQDDRCEVLAAIRSVDAVTVFDSLRVTEVIRAVKPDVYVKGGDYTPETLDAGEAAALRECGTEIRIVDLVPGRSTSAILEKARVPDAGS